VGTPNLAVSLRGSHEPLVSDGADYEDRRADSALAQLPARARTRSLGAMTISMDPQIPSGVYDVRDARDRYVSRAVTAPPLVVVGAAGARIAADDGRSYIDFAGGIGCQNLGHGPADVVRAIHEQVDRYLHQCFMVGMYEPYVEVCRRLAELFPGGGEYKSVLLNSGAEAVENAVKVARAATGRPAVIAFDRAFHGRTLLTMSLTSKVTPYKRGFGPFAPEVYRAPAPYEFRGIGSDDAIDGLRRLFKSDVDPESVACVVLEPVQGEGGFVPMPPDFPRRLQELCVAHGILYVDDEVQAGVGRTGPVWAIEHYGVTPDLLVSGKSLGGGLPLAAVTGRADVMDAVHPGGLGGTFGGNPVACAAAATVLDTVASPAFRAQAEALGRTIRERLEALASDLDCVGDVRGLGPMLALELVAGDARRTPAPELVAATVAAARERGLLLLSCGLYGNVIRLLPPISIGQDDLAEGLDALEASLRQAAAA
jgi:4-aminobutyrate aminotransferase/(S)-3-amino-2-methylpropionate transaminase